MTKFATYEDLAQFLDVTIEMHGVSVDNSGIGAYEYWGQRATDKGSDFLVYDGPRKITFPVTDVADEVIDDFWNEDYLQRVDHNELTIHIMARGRVQGEQFVIEIFEADEQGIPYRH